MTLNLLCRPSLGFGSETLFVPPAIEDVDTVRGASVDVGHSRTIFNNNTLTHVVFPEKNNLLNPSSLICELFTPMIFIP